MTRIVRTGSRHRPGAIDAGRFGTGDPRCVAESGLWEGLRGALHLDFGAEFSRIELKLNKNGKLWTLMSNFMLCCSSHFAKVAIHSGKPLNE